MAVCITSAVVITFVLSNLVVLFKSGPHFIHGYTNYMPPCLLPLRQLIVFTPSPVMLSVSDLHRVLILFPAVSPSVPWSSRWFSKFAKAFGIIGVNSYIALDRFELVPPKIDESLIDDALNDIIKINRVR